MWLNYYSDAFYILFTSALFSSVVVWAVAICTSPGNYLWCLNKRVCEMIRPSVLVQKCFAKVSCFLLEWTVPFVIAFTREKLLECWCLIDFKCYTLPTWKVLFSLLRSLTGSVLFLQICSILTVVNVLLLPLVDYWWFTVFQRWAYIGWRILLACGSRTLSCYVCQTRVQNFVYTLQWEAFR